MIEDESLAKIEPVLPDYKRKLDFAHISCFDDPQSTDVLKQFDASGTGAVWMIAFTITLGAKL